MKHIEFINNALWIGVLNNYNVFSISSFEIDNFHFSQKIRGNIQDAIVPNFLVRSQIDELMIYCPFGLTFDNDLQDWVLVTLLHSISCDNFYAVDELNIVVCIKTAR